MEESGWQMRVQRGFPKSLLLHVSKQEKEEQTKLSTGRRSEMRIETKDRKVKENKRKMQVGDLKVNKIYKS